MKKSTCFLMFTLSSLSILYAQEGKVGINTVEPQSTLDVNGDVRIGKIPEQTASPIHLLTTDDKGMVQKMSAQGFKTSDTNKMIFYGKMHKPDKTQEKGEWLIITYDDITLDNADISYDGKGTFTIKKTGYYLINVYGNVEPIPVPKDDPNGIADLVLLKNLPPNSPVQVNGMISGNIVSRVEESSTRVHNIDISLTDIQQFNVDDTLTLVVQDFRRNYNIKRGKLSIMYLDDKI